MNSAVKIITCFALVVFLNSCAKEEKVEEVKSVEVKAVAVEDTTLVEESASVDESILVEGQYYDLGGPCFNRFNKEEAAFYVKPSGSDPIEKEKFEVRGMCIKRNSWFSLVSTILTHGTKEEAVNVLEEMYSRKMMVNSVDSNWKDVAEFMESDFFKASRVAKKIEVRKALAEKKRLEAIEELKEMSEADKPHSYNITKDACPFECCTFGKWSVGLDTELFDSPNGTKVVGKVSKDEKVVAVTGEVHLEPKPIRIVYDITYANSSLEKGGVAFLLDYTGEGCYNFWYKGNIYNYELYPPADYCLFPSVICNIEYLYPEAKRDDSVWWVKIKTKEGIVGWTDKPGNFNNTRDCG